MVRSRIILILAIMLVGIIGGAAQANLVLTQGSTNIVISSPAVGNSGICGVTDWVIDGKDQMDLEWFWIKAGNLVGRVGSGTSILTQQQSWGTGGVQEYTDATLGYKMTVVWGLSDTGKGTSQLTELINVVNTGGTKDFRFYEYTDFDLDGSVLDKVQPSFMVGSQYGTITQQSPLGITGEVGVLTSEAADRYEATTVHGTLIPTIAAGNDLANTPGVVGPGDVEFALQWDRPGVLNNNGFGLTKSKTINVRIPEAGSMVLFGLGILGIGLARRFRKA